MGYVVPQVANVFVGTKKALPFLTVAMLATSDFVRSYGWWLLAALALFALGVHFALKNPVYREKFDAASLNAPVIGKLARGYNAARLGEQTGQMPLMLSRAAKQLSIEVQRRAMHLATILEPLLIVAMGVVVLLIVMAVLLPIIQLNQMVR